MVVVVGVPEVKAVYKIVRKLLPHALSLSHGVEGLLETSEKPIAQSSFSESVFSRADPAL
jgi:hypothetical protein